MASRTLGVHAKDRPALVPAAAQTSAINVAAMVFKSERGPAGVFQTKNPQEWAELYGGYEKNKFGRYAADGFFLNLAGNAGTLINQRFIAPGATAAFKVVEDAGGEALFKISAGYRGLPDVGKHGLRLMYGIEHTNRTSSAFSEGGTITESDGRYIVPVESALTFEIGDAIEIRQARASGDDLVLIGKIVEKDEAVHTLTITTAESTIPTFTWDATRTPVVSTLNFNLTVLKKNRVGVIQQLEVWRNLSMEAETSTYIEKELNNEDWGSINVLGSVVGVRTANIPLSLPAVTTDPVQFTEGGDEGIDATDDNWTDMLANFDTWTTIRHFCNPESTSIRVNAEGEGYCKKRGDAIWYANLALYDLSSPERDFLNYKKAATTLCRSDDSYMFVNPQWLTVSDPIGVGNNPFINIPNVSLTMAYAIVRMTLNGYQRVPAGIQVPYRGVLGVVGDQVLDDEKRTELADLGMNMIQYVAGSGIILRNARMASTNIAYKWYNQIFMRIVYKTSFKAAFESLENESTGEELLAKIRTTVTNFMQSDYSGNKRTGGKPAFLVVEGSSFDDVVTIICDESNNSISDVLNGFVTVDIYFTPPPPAESIEIGVGISLQIMTRAA